MEENGLAMSIHSAIIGLVAYVVMVHLLKQDKNMAEDRSALLAGISLVYMVLFGHKLPSKNINKNIIG